MIKAIAVDDEPFALDVVRSMAGRVPFIDLKAEFVNAVQAIDYLQQNPVDLIYLDIKMPDISGIDLINSLRQKPLVIFTTAFAEHAVTSFDLDAVDYLLKPFSLSRFIKASNKAQELFIARGGMLKQFIFVKVNSDLVRIDFDEIYHLEASGNNIEFVLRSGKVSSRMTMTEIELILPSDRFIRIHRSFIVSIEKIDKIEHHQLTINGFILPVGSNYSKYLRAVK